MKRIAYSRVVKVYSVFFCGTNVTRQTDSKEQIREKARQKKTNAFHTAGEI